MGSEEGRDRQWEEQRDVGSRGQKKENDRRKSGERQRPEGSQQRERSRGGQRAEFIVKAKRRAEGADERRGED